MRIALLLGAAVAVAVAAAMTWQHLRYLRVRRDAVQDRQPLLHGGGVFHVVTFLRVGEGADVVEAVRKLEGETSGFEGVRWVYAGKVVVSGRRSSQLGGIDWSAVTVVQFPSREAYEEAARSETWRRALARFEHSYAHGMQRPPLTNLMLPQLLLARRAAQVATRQPSHFPFEPLPESDSAPLQRALAQRLLSERELGERAVAVVNLIKRGTSEQRANDARYVGHMLGAMAEGGYGPLHMGRAVTLEGDADFDQVAIVYYPGVEFFAAMTRSSFFQGIVGDKQLGDTQALITVPILDRL